jgi:hypothetical protein
MNISPRMSDVMIQNNIFYELAQGWAAIQSYVDTTRRHVRADGHPPGGVGAIGQRNKEHTG